MGVLRGGAQCQVEGKIIHAQDERVCAMDERVCKASGGMYFVSVKLDEERNGSLNLIPASRGTLLTAVEWAQVCNGLDSETRLKAVFH